MRLLAAALVCASVVTACASTSEISGDRRNVGNVTVTFRIEPARVKSGQPVHVTLRLVNNGGNPVTLTYPTGQKYDFWATRAGREVWRWSSGQVFVQEVTNDAIDPQSARAFSASWVPPNAGRYTLHAVSEADGFEGSLDGRIEVS